MKAVAKEKAKISEKPNNSCTRTKSSHGACNANLGILSLRGRASRSEISPFPIQDYWQRVERLF